MLLSVPMAVSLATPTNRVSLTATSSSPDLRRPSLSARLFGSTRLMIIGRSPLGDPLPPTMLIPRPGQSGSSSRLISTSLFRERRREGEREGNEREKEGRRQERE